MLCGPAKTAAGRAAQQRTAADGGRGAAAGLRAEARHGNGALSCSSDSSTRNPSAARRRTASRLARAANCAAKSGTITLYS
eukprot:gene16566-2878_t